MITFKLCQSDCEVMQKSFLYRRLVSDMGFTALSIMFHLCQADCLAEVGENWGSPGKKALDLLLAELGFLTCAPMRLEHTAVKD